MPSDSFNPSSSSVRRALQALVFLAGVWLLCEPSGAQIPGLQFPVASEASDQKPGSVLFFNYFTSSGVTPNITNTEISITNTSTTNSVVVRLYFVDGTTGANTSSFLFLTPIQTATLLASNVLPGVTGYIVAVAVNSATQCPINFNSLVGEAVFKQTSGHGASLNAVAIAAVAATPATCAGSTTTLNFDGVSYNRVPRTVSLDQIVSRADGNDTLFIINRVGGSLTVGSSAATIGTLNGLLYDDAEVIASFTRTQATPQFASSLTNSFPVVSPPFQTFIPAGRIGWMKTWNAANDFGYLGAAVNFNPNAGASVSAFNNGHNLTHRTLAATPNYTVPLTAPDLVVSKTHSGNFTLGGTGSYNIIVTNNGSAMSSMMNTITLTDQLPSDLTLTGFSGTGWSCTGVGTATAACSTNATLAAAASAPTLTLTVNVGAKTPTGTNSITNTANVSNAQELNTSNNSSSNPTTICDYTLTPTAASFPLAGGSRTVAVTTSATCAWTAVSNDAWISVTGGSSGTGNGTVSYMVAANAGTAPRTGSMTIGGTIFPISQAANGLLVYTDFNSGIPIDWTVEHFGNGTYIPNGAPATWTTANPCMRSPGSPFQPGSFAIVDATCTNPNVIFNERLITPSFDMTGLGTVYVEFFNRFLGVGASGNAGDVEFSTNGGSTWPFGLQHFQNGNIGPSVLSLNLATLVGVNSPNARVRLRYTGFGIQPSGPSRPEVQEVDWAIDFAIYYYTLAPTSQNFPASGGSGNITVATSPVVPSPQGMWTAVSNAPWITPASPSGTGNGSIGYTVAANPTSSPRTGTMTVASNTFTVTQSGCTPPTITPATLPNGFVSVAYNQTLTASSGVAPYTFSVSAGTLPNGLNLTAAGLLSGTPTANGTFSFTAKATDAIGCMGTRTYTVIISGSGPTSLMFYPLPRPVRLLDTRAAQGNCDSISTPIAAGTSLTTLARITCESITIPATAQAVVGNLTVLNQTAQTGYLTIYPDGGPVPLAANMVYEPGGILSNNFTVGLSSDGKFNIFGERTIDVVVDISGYYAPPGAGGLYYHPLPKPIRLLDTRPAQGNCDSVSTPIPAGTSLTTQARTTCETLTIPAAAQAIVGNATVLNGSGQVGYLTIYPNGVPVPLAANMVYFPGQLLSNAFTVSLNASGEFNIFGERTIDMVIDVAGYYSNEATDVNGAGLLFTPLVRPLRILDTRPAQGNCDAVGTPIIGGTSIATPGRLTCENITIPSTAQTVLGNVTVINQTGQAGYLTLYPDGVAQPLAANMIYFPGQILSNAFVVGLNTGTGQFRIFAERTLDAIVDVSGYFAP